MLLGKEGKGGHGGELGGGVPHGGDDGLPQGATWRGRNGGDWGGGGQGIGFTRNIIVQCCMIQECSCAAFKLKCGLKAIFGIQFEVWGVGQKKLYTSYLSEKKAFDRNMRIDEQSLASCMISTFERQALRKSSLVIL